MRSLAVLLVAGSLGFSGIGCKGALEHRAESPEGEPQSGSCRALAPQVLRFGETLMDAGAISASRTGSFAGLLELLVTIEGASADLEGQLAASATTDPSMDDVMKRIRTTLEATNEFAHHERERIEAFSTRLAPVATESDAAFKDLRVMCEGTPRAAPSSASEASATSPGSSRGARAQPGRAPRDCAVVNEIVGRMAKATFVEHVKLTEEDLAAAKIASPVIGKARDRAVHATTMLKNVVGEQAREVAALDGRWKTLQTSVSKAFEAFGARCKETPFDPGSRFVADEHPDPRKLTVLVKVKPPAEIGRTFEALARSAAQEDERDFYHSRTLGAFGSGFVVVRRTADGTGREALVVTNRHVVELGDRAELELADGTSLGPADILYTDTSYDIAILRPREKLAVTSGFAFATDTTRDQAAVVATGFPGMGGRPSYQTTRGYVSNEAFKIAEGGRELLFVQHTAPIDPGSSGGPLTDARGNVIGVNTLKVNHRDSVGLAIPAVSVLEAIRRADAVEARHASQAHRKESARLACLALVGELANAKPRLPMLESMIANTLTSTEGLEASRALEKDADFGQLWESDSVRAMRIATLVRIHDGLAKAGGASSLETCSENGASVDANADEVRFRIRTGSWELREVSFRWEQGHYKLARMTEESAPSSKTGAPTAAGSAKAKKAGTTGASKPAAPKSSSPRPRS